ncbi:MAG: hypothetical protein QOH62_1211 [Solirubrobacteraceae bacterium]|nr:hypothetical protein [Solirubrobacteraceae bacterium]
MAHGSAAYELLLCALLGLMAAGRLWLVPGYFRADTWLALTAGRDVWTSGVPRYETLTALASGERWIDQQWLAHLATYGLYRVGGFGLIGALSVVLAATSFAAVCVAAWRWGARARSLLVLMPVTAFPFFAQSWQPRTQMFAYPLFAAVFLILLRDARRPSARVLLVFPVLAVWANVHGSAFLGAALISLRGGVLLWERRHALGRLRAWPMPLILTALPPAVLLLTPYGIGTAGYYRNTLLDGSFKALATEWQPITHDPILIGPFVAVLALTGWTLLRARPNTSVWERLALIVVLAAAATAVRNMVWLTLGALPVLVIAVDRIVPADPPPSAVSSSVNRTLAAVAAVALIVALGVTLARPTSRFELAYPQSYLDAVHRAATIDPESRIVADVGDADWLLWRDPSLRGRIAFDARLELLSASGVHDIGSLLRGDRAASSLRDASLRIFALDRRTAAPTVRRLEAADGRRILFADRTRIVILLTRPASPERAEAR